MTRKEEKKRRKEERRNMSRSARKEAGSLIGRQQEERVKKILTNAKADDGTPLFKLVVRHQPMSVADHCGLDYTLLFDGEDGEVEISFGITISLTRWHHHRELRPYVPQCFLPVSLSDSEIVEKVLALFPDLTHEPYFTVSA